MCPAWVSFSKGGEKGGEGLKNGKKREKTWKAEKKGMGEIKKNEKDFEKRDGVVIFFQRGNELIK